jgi:transposase-like protein
MNNPQDTPYLLQARLTWVQMYQETGNAGLTCRRCGISRPTLRKWHRRYEAKGEAGLLSRSRRRAAAPPAAGSTTQARQPSHSR